MATARVGDQVSVPGDMYGVVKFVGSVAGKTGTFAGVQLAAEFAPRGKNSGDVDGKHYFRTTIPGSGIFLPLEKAVKTANAGKSNAPAARGSPGPGTPTRLTSFNQGGRTPALAKPSFSQSVGPGALRVGAASPALKPPVRRESLPRPSSPLRKINTPGPEALATPKTRPSLTKSTMARPGTQKASAGPRAGNKFSQSLRQSSTAPSKPSLSPLGPESSFDEVPEEEAQATPTPTPNINRDAEADTEKHQEEVQRLQQTIDERDRELRDQAGSIAEMERSLVELQKIMPGLSGDDRTVSSVDDEDLPRDIVSLRAALRDKNERIKLLTAEFDGNRADFRSTIDTLEMASTETERVYEKRVDELLEEVRGLQDRSEDVENVAHQLKQLEELVQELEEGLEDARRGEAEARGEVEFLRGEVERSRSELRRERDRMRTEEQLNGYGSSDGGDERIEELQAQLESKEDEIRGLKVIIHNLNNNNSSGSEASKTNGNSRWHVRNDSAATDENGLNLQQQIFDLEKILQQKSAHEEELENEVTKLRHSVHLSNFPMPSSTYGMRTGGAVKSHNRNSSSDLRDKHQSSGTQVSQRTVVLSPRNDREERNDSPTRGASPVKRELDRDAKHEDNSASAEDGEKSDAGVTDASSAALWCEICEEGGHDILTCGNMFGQGKAGGKGKVGAKDAQRSGLSGPAMNPDRPAPLVSRKSNLSSSGAAPEKALPTPPLERTFAVKESAQQIHSEPHSDYESASEGESRGRELKAPIEGIGEQAGMWAGKSSGMIDPDKWCALCERDGHESVDCPIEDAF